MRLVVLLLAAVCGCTPAASDALVLRAYDVPAEHAAELQGIVEGLLWVGKDQPRRGSAALAPSGQLLVSAPAGFQPGIADVIAKLKSGPATTAPTITLDYWIVLGASAAADTKGALVAPEIGPALDALLKSQGGMKLALMERLSVSSQSGSDGRAEGSLWQTKQTAAVHGDKVVADIDIRGMRIQGDLQTRVEIPIGKIVVLGQAGSKLGGPAREMLVDPDLAKAADVGTATAFYIVRAQVEGK